MQVSPPFAPALRTAAAAAVQGYQMREEEEDEGEEDEDGNIIYPEHDGGIRTAVRAWCTDPASAKAKYGPIASWDTSGITSMKYLFIDKEDFNEDISHWNVSNVEEMNYMFDGATSFTGDLSSWEVGQVESMRCMFEGATSFTHQLGGAWPTSTADKHMMFYNSPGTIAGKVKDASGTIR